MIRQKGHSILSPRRIRLSADAHSRSSTLTPPPQRIRRGEEEFARWLGNKSRCGGHPFEIVYSWHGHGIHLFPPYLKNPCFTLTVTDYMYALPFLEMVKALIRKKIPFNAHDLEKVLDYLSGESYFTVNTYAKHYIFYNPGDRKLSKSESYFL